MDPTTTPGHGRESVNDDHRPENYLLPDEDNEPTAD
jgi:hypothetical protein